MCIQHQGERVIPELLFDNICLIVSNRIVKELRCSLRIKA